MYTTGNIIKFLRKKHNLTQKELGDILGVEKSAIQKYEKGVITNLKTNTIKKLCDYFDVQPWLFVMPERIPTGLLENTLDVYSINKYDQLRDAISNLNTIGIQKVFEYTMDISHNKKYLKLETVSVSSEKGILERAYVLD